MPLFDATYVAGADLSTLQFCMVYVDSSGTAQVWVTGKHPIGVLQDKAASGKACSVRELGHTKAVAGGTITKGDPLKPVTATGRLVTGIYGTDKIVGVAMETATATGQIIEVVLSRS